MSGVRAQWPVVGGASTQTGRGGKYPSVPTTFSPLGEPSFQPRACLKGEKRHNMRGRRPPASPACEWRRGGQRGFQVARLSAGRPDMRIWELLLLRMESWVPPFTPLLARDGCRCLKSTAKYRFTFQLRHLRLISACTCREQRGWSPPRAGTSCPTSSTCLPATSSSALGPQWERNTSEELTAAPCPCHCLSRAR